MSVDAYLLEHTDAPGSKEVNKTQNMIVAIDSTVDTTAALRKARGVTLAVAAGVPLPTGYFDTERKISTVWATAGFFTLFGRDYKQAETVA